MGAKPTECQTKWKGNIRVSFISFLPRQKSLAKDLPEEQEKEREVVSHCGIRKGSSSCTQ